MSNTSENILVEVSNIRKDYPLSKTKILRAVDNVSFTIKQGETLGLVGESGCGKSTTGKLLTKLEDITSGTVKFDGKDISTLNGAAYKAFTRDVQMIFQDPYASLDSRMTAGDIVGEGISIHKMYDAAERQAKIYDLLTRVGLNKEHANRFPHEFSGGQRQRIGIARALALEPRFIVCDEPISALDVSIQAQVINLLMDLQEEMKLTYLFIAHDLGVVKYISDRVAVMYLGSIVEISRSDELYHNPVHPYTKALLSAIPIPDPKLTRSREKILLTGEIPTPINPKPGCKFQTRCRYCTERCRTETPELKEISPEHFVACHLI